MMNRIRTAIEAKRAANQIQAFYGWRPGPGRELIPGRHARHNARPVMHIDSAESAGGRLGAVLLVTAIRSGRPRAARTVAGHHAWPGRDGAHRRDELRLPGRREPQRRPVRAAGATRAPGTRRLPARAARPGRAWAGRLRRRVGRHAVGQHDRTTPGEPYDAMRAAASSRGAIHDVGGPALSRPRPTATTSPTCVLGWIDALGPVIAARRPPGGGAGRRRRERDARLALEEALAAVPKLDAPPQQLRHHAGRRRSRSPSPPGAWLLRLARQPPERRGRTRARRLGDAAPDASHLDHRSHLTREVDLGGRPCARGGHRAGQPPPPRRLPELVPGDPGGSGRLRPRPLADASAAPGRVAPVRGRSARVPGPQPRAWPSSSTSPGGALDRNSRLSEPVSIDQSRGIAPRPCRFTARLREGGVMMVEHAALQDTSVAEPGEHRRSARSPRSILARRRPASTTAIARRGRALPASSLASRSSPSALTSFVRRTTRRVEPARRAGLGPRVVARRAPTRRLLPPPGAGPEAAL